MNASEHQTERDPLPNVDALIRIVFTIRAPRGSDGLAIKPCSAMALERRLDALAGPAAQWPLQPLSLRCLKRSFRCFDHGFRKELPRDLPNQPLSRVVEYLSLDRLAQSYFEKAVIQKRLS